MTIQRKRRKYRIAVQLAQYDETTQRQLIQELCTKLGIGRKMFSHYMYVLVDETKLCNMSSDKLQVIAQYFNVELPELLANINDTGEAVK